MAKILSYAEIKYKFDNSRNKDYELITKEDPLNPIKSRTTVEVIHKPCGNILSTKLQAFVNENKGHCRKCYPLEKATTWTEKEFIDNLRKTFGSSLVYVSGYTSKGNKCILRHECGNEYSIIAREVFRYNTSGCKKCAHKNRGSYQASETYLQDIIVEGYVWLEDYQGDNKIKHKIKHKSCGLEYTVKPNDFQQGYRCPVCSERIAPADSRNAKRIERSLKEYGLTFHKEYIDKRCKSDKNGQLRFDFAIEYDDGRLIIIEYDGEFHDGEFYDENIKNEWTKREVANTIRRDKIKDKFVKDHPEKYIAMHRITHKDPVIKTLDSILNIYYEFTIEI